MKKVLSIILCLVMVLSVFAVIPLNATAANVKKIVDYNGHTYQLFVGNMTWKAAKEECEKRGGYLAAINSAEENSVLQKMLSGLYYGVWVGGSDEGSEGDWYWVNGDDFTYTCWANGEPNNVNDNEHYLKFEYTGVWNDESVYASSVGGFICEYDSIQAIEPEQTAEYNNHRYELFAFYLTWKQAKEFCEQRGGYLAVINTAEEDALVYGMTTGMTNGVWLGGSDEGSEGNWRWINGDDFSYTNWANGEPSNSNGNEHYLELFISDSNYPGKWNDAQNAEISLNGFICEYDPSYILGDANGDEDVSSVDVTLIQRYSADFNINIPEETLLHGDVDGSGDLDIRDATLIQRYLADFNVQYSIGEWV